MCSIQARFTTSSSHPTGQSLQHRGPDQTAHISLSEKIDVCFHRLAIRDLSHDGDQPFSITTGKHTITRLTNGEIYNYHDITQEYNFTLQGSSDCEVIGHLYLEGGIDLVLEKIRGEFAGIIIDQGPKKTKRYTMRDPFGVRPLFIGSGEQGIGFASEMKGLLGYDHIEPALPGHYYTSSESLTIYTSHRYHSLPTTPDQKADHTLIDTLRIAVEKRLESDRPLGCLLSGGLDSSLVAGIAASLSEKPIRTYTIGLEGGTDLHYAQLVADYIGSDHTVFHISRDEALEAIDHTIRSIESRDTTTVRASTFQYLIGEKISTQTDTRVILTGEGADELMGGYKYFHKAPSAQDFDSECRRLLNDIYLYDGLRADRAMAAHGLEVRIPFLDVDFVHQYLSIDADERMPTNGKEKSLIKTLAEPHQFIPHEVLRRSKEAFSDGVSSTEDSRFSIIQSFVESYVTDDMLTSASQVFPHCPPQTKEQYYYRMKFREFFGEKHDDIIPYYWMPRRSPETTDPSARTLDVYSS